MSNTSPEDGPTSILWSTESSSEWSAYPEADRVRRLRRLFTGDAWVLSFAVTTQANNGTQADTAEIGSSYVEASVRYRVRCAAATATCVDNDDCCDGNCDTGICQ